LNDIIVLLLEIVNMKLTDKLKDRCSEETLEHNETFNESVDTLRESEDLFQLLFDYSADCILLSVPDGSILAANASACRMFGRTEEELRQIGFNGIVDMSDPRWAIALEERARTGVFRSEYFHIRKDGSVFPCEATSTLFKDRKGRVRASTIVRDITKRKKAEERLKEEKEKLFAIINATTDAIYLFDINGVILAINEAGAERLDIEFSKAIGANVYEGVPPEVEERRRSRVGEAVCTKKPGYYEADKRGRWFDTCLYPVITNGIVTGIALYGRDITRRKQAEEELRKYHEHLEELVEDRTFELKAVNKELESFSYSVSHDLRAPLRAIDGFSRILSEEHSSHLSEEAQRYIGLVRASARQMGKLIDDLLTFSRLGRQALTKQPVAPVDIVHQVIEQLRYMQENRHIEISIGDLPVCQSDPSLLRVLYMNLVSNALKFTSKRDNAFVEIGCRNEDGENVYYVKDNGVGFNMKYVEKLFRVFQRLHRADEYEGTGVGLANVQRIVQRHGGRIWVTSEVDKGTTFYFILKKGGKLS
jgi:PAS domain S-box-containing protein